MAQTWSVIRGDTETQISGGTLSYRVSVTNVGAPPKRNLSTRGPFQHGESFYGFRYDKRIISLVFFADAASLSLADAQRDDIYNLWRGVEGETDPAPAKPRRQAGQASRRESGGKAAAQDKDPGTGFEALQRLLEGADLAYGKTGAREDEPELRLPGAIEDGEALPGLARDRDHQGLQALRGEPRLERLARRTAEGQQAGRPSAETPDHPGDVDAPAPRILPRRIAAELVLGLDDIDRRLEVEGGIEGQGRNARPEPFLSHPRSPGPHCRDRWPCSADSRQRRRVRAGRARAARP